MRNAMSNNVTDFYNKALTITSEVDSYRCCRHGNQQGCKC